MGDFNVYPNPVVTNHTSQIKIEFFLEKSVNLNFLVFDNLGRVVGEIQHEGLVGDNYLTWDLKGQSGHYLPSGQYYIVALDQDANVRLKNPSKVHILTWNVLLSHFPELTRGQWQTFELGSTDDSTQLLKSA